MAKKVVRIGGASGFWGDAAVATPQLLGAGGLDYIVYDYLAEITMSIMARARSKNPEAGYATDFVASMLKSNLVEIAEQGVKIIANAGGVNPRACAAAVRALIAEKGLGLKVATVLGDDLMDRLDDLAADQPLEMFSKEAFPDTDRVMSMNAYLGAFPIAEALNNGADIVITGRSVDSAVTLGACIHEFGWTPTDLDQLSGGSLAGHILECGPQATGGNFTDWETVIDSLDSIGYPIAEVAEDGSFICTKPAGTGGIVTVGTVAEQMMYEIGDPQAYILPDVVCDFSAVAVTQDSPDRVLVKGARGAAAPNTYKVCTTYSDGFRGGVVRNLSGLNADRKAQGFAEAAFKRARSALRAINAPDYTETCVEVVGAETQYGAARKVEGVREVAMKIAAKHPDARGISILLREVTGLGLATPPGLSGFAGGRPKPSPVVRLFSFALPKSVLSLCLEIDGTEAPFEDVPGVAFNAAAIVRPERPPEAAIGDAVEVPLVALAWGRSGDKGNKANIGIIARDPAYLPYICAVLTEAAVAEYFAHFLEGPVERFLLPGSHAVNFLLHDVLGGGGVASLRNDPQAKGYAQLLLDYPIAVPRGLASKAGIEPLSTLT